MGAQEGEDPAIVAAHYGEVGWATLRVRPGLTSPGSLYYFTHCEQLLQDGDAERAYVERVLPLKLQLDAVYVERASLAYDIRLVLRTIFVIGVYDSTVTDRLPVRNGTLTPQQ